MPVSAIFHNYSVLGCSKWGLEACSVTIPKTQNRKVARSFQCRSKLMDSSYPSTEVQVFSSFVSLCDLPLKVLWPLKVLHGCTIQESSLSVFLVVNVIFICYILKWRYIRWIIWGRDIEKKEKGWVDYQIGRNMHHHWHPYYPISNHIFVYDDCWCYFCVQYFWMVDSNRIDRWMHFSLLLCSKVHHWNMSVFVV